MPRGRALWWTAALALAALLAGGGTVLAATSGSSSPPATGPTGQAAALNSMLNSASSPGADGAAGNAGTTAASATPCRTRAAKLKASGHPRAARFARWRCHRGLLRVRLLGGLHGEFTFATKTGTRTLAYERGTVKSVSGSDVVVGAKDGTTWTWVLGSSTVVRQDHKKVTSSALTDGAQVFVGGPVTGSTYDARLIVVRPSSTGTSPSTSPSPSPSAATG